MNRWADRYATALERELEPGETLLAACRVNLVGQAADPAARARRATTDVARRLGFPLPAKLFVLGVSDQRLLLWRATRWTAAPESLFSSLRLEQVAAVRRLRRLTGRRLAVMLEARSLLVVGPMWGGALQDLESAFAMARPFA